MVRRYGLLGLPPIEVPVNAGAVQRLPVLSKVEEQERNVMAWPPWRIRLMCDILCIARHAESRTACLKTLMWVLEACVVTVVVYHQGSVVMYGTTKIP